MQHLTLKVKGREVHFYPVADVQTGADGVDEAGFREYIREALQDPFARFIGVGDYTDGISPSNRKVLAASFVKGELYDTLHSMIDDAAQRNVKYFTHLVRGTEGMWDFLLKGHHTYDYVLGDRVRNTDQDIADAVRAPYLGAGIAVVSYQFASGRPLRVWARHGEGSGDTFAAPLNSAEKQMRAFNADIYFIAHHHKNVAGAAVKLDEDPMSETELKAQDARLVGCGSWLRGFLKDKVSYAEEGLMVPLATGAPIVTAIRRSDGTFRIRATV